MSPKEKALKLCQDFGYLGMQSEQTEFYTLELSLSKKCALICVDEILKAVTTIADKKYDFFLDVKREIEKL